jgi:hypothetical protein
MSTFTEELPACVASPCNECPWRTVATPGHLGPHSPREWLRLAHADTAIACHKTIQVSESWEGTKQCAGAASFRANVAKRSRDPNVSWGPPRNDVFQSNEEFMRHHTRGKEGWTPSDMWGDA